jgi:hypothetical protein
LHPDQLRSDDGLPAVECSDESINQGIRPGHGCTEYEVDRIKRAIRHFQKALYEVEVMHPQPIYAHASSPKFIAVGDSR